MTNMEYLEETPSDSTCYHAINVLSLDLQLVTKLDLLVRSAGNGMICLSKTQLVLFIEKWEDKAVGSVDTITNKAGKSIFDDAMFNEVNFRATESMKNEDFINLMFLSLTSYNKNHPWFVNEIASNTPLPGVSKFDHYLHKFFNKVPHFYVNLRFFQTCFAFNLFHNYNMDFFGLRGVNRDMYFTLSPAGFVSLRDVTEEGLDFVFQLWILNTISTAMAVKVKWTNK